MRQLVATYFLFVSLGLFGQVQSPYYQTAYDQIVSMLDGRTELSIKDAVFLSEWAYYDGNIDYQTDYCDEIDRIVSYLNRFITSNQLLKYRTGKNLALNEFFFKPWSGNNYTPYIYDSEVESDNDWSSHFVVPLLKSHKGQCRSLPWLYKILADEIGAEAYIAHAPSHCFIRYRDLDHFYPEEWVNLELTSRQIQPEFWIKEYFVIKDEAVKAKTYLYPLTQKETIANQLADLGLGYNKKYGIYDQFTLTCSEISLKYYPYNPTAIIIQGKSLEALLLKHLEKNGGYADDYTDKVDEQLKALQKQLDASYWTPETPELRNRWRASIE